MMACRKVTYDMIEHSDGCIIVTRVCWCCEREVKKGRCRVSVTAISSSPRKPNFGFIPQLPRRTDFLRRVSKMMDSVDIQTSLLQHELHLWRLEYICDGCIIICFPLLQLEGGKKCITHTLVPVRLGSVGLKPTKKVPVKKTLLVRRCC
ncbi:hypothetical protein EVAR_65281_1 [Eumeta japonica]|uniref:Uncharacterized protein n=1 Tax=Eumeta variegata TaxID=151549 RepID=A0A4C1ZNF0_EUMVA|nr:hypothetical protein EVAR_65281_1 [Eumeta japonica]